MGIELTEAKVDLVYGRLARRLRLLGLQRFGEYLDLLEREPVDGAEAVEFINAITTNVTWFFREGAHFEALRDRLLPHLLEARRAGGRLRIWSAGCSTGAEAYSIAMVLRECVHDLDSWDVRILATDISEEVLATGRQGVYGIDGARPIPPQRLKRHFLRGTGGNAGLAQVRPEIRQLVTFRRLSLMESVLKLTDDLEYEGGSIYRAK